MPKVKTPEDLMVVSFTVPASTPAGKLLQMSMDLKAVDMDQQLVGTERRRGEMPTRKNGGTVAQHLLYLIQNGGPQKVSVMKESMEKAGWNPTSIGSEITRLVNDNQIAKTEHATYGLTRLALPAPAKKTRGRK